MIELFKRTENGMTTKIEFDVVKNNNGIYVDFVRSEYSDYNKWKNPNVLTDKFLERCYLDSTYLTVDPTGEVTKKYIREKFSKEAKVIKEIEQLSSHIDYVEISLPTSVLAHNSVRGFKDTFLPLIVRLNNEDVSIQFMDYDTFGPKAVEVAFDSVVNGNIPKSDKELVDFEGVRDLHDSFIKTQE